VRRVFVFALSLTILLPLVAVLLAFAAASSQAQCGGGGAIGPGSAPGVPANLLAIYEQAAGSYQLGPSGWAYLAAINEIETSFGHNLSTSTVGAIGWMQIMPTTWTQYQVSADPANPGAPPDPYDPWDAIFTAARYLQASGAPGDWPTALYAYNHAGWYVAQTQQLAQHYAQTAGSPVTAVGGVPQPACVTPGPTTPGTAAQILPDGLAAIPQGAPAQVQAAIAAGTASSTPPTRKSASRTCSPP
jgi:Transglycosylase SLT domain